MLRTCICVLSIFASSPVVLGQGFGGNTGTGQTGGGQAGALSGFGAQTGGATGTGATAAAGQASPFSFDPRFSATPFGSAFGTGGLGGVGGFGGGLGGLGGGFGGGGFGGGGFGGGGFGGRGGFGQNSQQQQNQTKIRATAKVGFKYTAPQPQARAANLRSTLTRLPITERFNQAQIDFNGRTAVVSGSFEDADDIDVLKQLLLLQPGIEDVDVRNATSSAAANSVVPSPVTGR